MGEFKHGVVTLEYPDTFTIPAESGTLTLEAARRLPKDRRGIGLACQMTSEAMKKYPDKLNADGVQADTLTAQGEAAEQIDLVIADLESTLAHFKQANLLLDARAHTELRKVLAHVRAREKLDPRVTDLVTHLVAYFANAPADPPTPTPA